MRAKSTAVHRLQAGALAGPAAVQHPASHPQADAGIVLASISAGVITTDLTGRITFVNEAAARLTGWEPAEAIGQSLEAVLPLRVESTRQPVSNLAMRCLAEDRPVDLEPGVLLVRRDGSTIPVGDSAAPIRDQRGQTTGVVLLVQDESEKRRVGRRLVYEATHDVLTGLINRREFDRRLGRVVNGPAPASVEQALIILDLDGFKQVNDRGGHGAGDEVLRQLGPVLTRHLRQRDTVGRLGGDEFGVLLENCPMTHAERVAESLRAAIAGHRFATGGVVHAVSASIGLVPVTRDGGGVAQLMRRADAACYEAKAAGGDRVQVVRAGAPILTPSSAGRMARLVQAAEEGSFRLYAQPILPLQPSQVAPPWFEVLLRLPDGRGGVQDAAEFLPTSAHDPMMSAIDHWVVQAVIALLGQWQRDHPDTELPVCSVNLGGSSLTGDSLLSVLEQNLRLHGVPGGHLCFEVDESVACGNLARAGRLVAGLRAAGCGVALDHYSGGPGSLACLQSLPVTCIKVPASLLQGRPGNPRWSGVERSLGVIRQSLGLPTVATHVEGRDSLERLRALGLGFAQGRSLAPPAPLADPQGRVVVQRLHLLP
jgi:Amt family ammonium transporter